MGLGGPKDHLNDDVAEDWLLEVQLVALTFAVGINDVVTYTNFHTFVTNQTGNTIFLAVGSLGIAKSQVDLRHVGLSLGGFISGATISGRLANTFGRRKRPWLIATNFVQSLIVYAAAGLIHWYILEDFIAVKAYAAIVLLAFAGGLQISMARAINIAELPTGMITTGYTDFLNDPDVLKLRNRKRNRRICSVGSMLVGAYIGSIGLRYSGPALSLLLSALVKTVVTVAFFFNRTVPKSKNEALVAPKSIKQPV